MKYPQLTAEVWKPERELQPWEDPSELTDSELVSVNLRITVNPDEVTYIMESFRAERTLLIFNNGSTLTVIGDYKTVNEAIYG